MATLVRCTTGFGHKMKYINTIKHIITIYTSNVPLKDPWDLFKSLAEASLLASGKTQTGSVVQYPCVGRAVGRGVSRGHLVRPRI